MVLLDEIEKAHPDVFNMLLQVMEEGQLTDSFGRHVDFRNVILILTSNVGADLIKNKGGFGFSKHDPEADYGKIKKTLETEVERYFRPEFINRLDEMIVFRPLTKEDLYTVVDFELAKVFKRLEEKQMVLELDDAAKEFLIDKGYNPDFGARPLRRAIGQYVEDPLSEQILRGDVRDGQLIRVTRPEDKDHLVFDAADAPPKPDSDGEQSPDNEADEQAVTEAGTPG